MAGHSHWAQIKRAKGANDAKRGNLFSKISREITVSARMGGGDPSFNPRLRQAIATAKNESMPNDTIDRALKKGTGELGADTIEEMLYEGYGAGGIAMLVQATTDNKNRTAAEIRSLFSKNQGNMGAPGSVAWMFQHKALILLPPAATEEAILEASLDAGTEDIRAGGEGWELICPPDKLNAVESALRAASLSIQSSKFVHLPTTLTALTDEKVAASALKLIEALEEHEDVQQVFSNIDLSEEMMGRLA